LFLFLAVILLLVIKIAGRQHLPPEVFDSGKSSVAHSAS
jgi:hypothetical protein